RKIRVTQSVVGRRRSDSGSQDRKRGRAPLPSQEEGTGRVFQRILDLVQPDGRVLPQRHRDEERRAGQVFLVEEVGLGGEGAATLLHAPAGPAPSLPAQ